MKGIIIEIDAEENYHLLEGIANKFFITRLDQRRAEKKVGHGYVTGNLLCKKFQGCLLPNGEENYCYV